MKKIFKNKKAVSNVVGTMLMLAIMMPVIAMVSISFTQMMTTQRVMMDSQIDLMQRFTEYVNEIYFYFSPAFGDNNHAPFITDEYPENHAFNVERQPTCHVYISDTDGDNLAVSFFEYASASQKWEKLNDTVFCKSNTTVYWDYINADRIGVTYYWYVAVYDGIVITTSEIYSFKTTLLDPSMP